MGIAAMHTVFSYQISYDQEPTPHKYLTFVHPMEGWRQKNHVVYEIKMTYTAWIVAASLVSGSLRTVQQYTH